MRMVDQAQASLHGSKVLLNEQVDWHSSNGNTSPVRLLSTYWFLTEWEMTDKHRKKATVMTYLDNRWELDNSMNSYLASYRHRWLNIEISIEMSVCTECVCSAQPCSTVCDPMDCSLPGSSVHPIFQARILEQVAISPSRGSSRPRDRTHVSCVGRQILYP